MENSIFISKVEHCSYLKYPFSSATKMADGYNKCLDEVRQKVSEKIDGTKFSRLYFGQEFCEKLFPSIKDVKHAMQQAYRNDMEFTLVTPYVTDEGLVKVRKLLEFINRKGREIEVVFNDFGTLRLINIQYPDFTPVAGRLIDKMKRDPRYSTKDYEEFFSPQAQSMLKKSNIDASSYRQLLKNWGVDRVEFDPVPQGFDMDFEKLGVNASVYIPFGYVTFGRACFIGSLSYPKQKKFKIHYRCKKECQRYDQYMQKTIAPIPDAVEKNDRLGEIRLIRKGRTVFFINDRIETIFGGGNFNRVIYQPQIPI